MIGTPQADALAHVGVGGADVIFGFHLKAADLMELDAEIGIANNARRLEGIWNGPNEAPSTMMLASAVDVLFG
jgi:hypothetical protein